MLWGFSLTGRPVAIPVALAAITAVFIWCRRKKILKMWAVFLLGIVLVSGAAAVFNHIHGWKYGPFYNVLPYTIHYNTAQNETGTGKIPQNNDRSFSRKLLTTAGKMVMRAPMMFSVRELPENQNIYFWREKMPLLRMKGRALFSAHLTFWNVLQMCVFIFRENMEHCFPGEKRGAFPQ